jgi:hypothetical protein
VKHTTGRSVRPRVQEQAPWGNCCEQAITLMALLSGPGLVGGLMASLLILPVCEYSERHRQNPEDDKDHRMHLAVNKNAMADFR